MVTDPVDLNLPAMADLAVSVYVPGAAPPSTQHSLGLHTTFISKEGDAAGQDVDCRSVHLRRSGTGFRRCR